MLIYKQRYKPRTTREFTKSDLTVYDSAGNTALNALTVYGKSEVVDGSIKSAGEGYAVIDLGTLTWTYYQYGNINGFYSTDLVNVALKPATNCITDSYNFTDNDQSFNTNNVDMQIIINYAGYVKIKNNAYTGATAFKTAMSGVLLCYELADPTQGNCIAVKTDDGTGINGTMAVFSTGTPLRGIPDTTVRDVMVWDDSAGTVTKNCVKVRLADLTWNASSIQNVFYTILNDTKDPEEGGSTAICNKYTQSYTRVEYMADKSFVFNNSTQSSTTGILYVKDTDYTTVEDFVASLGGAELVYELATPTTEQLTTVENNSIAGLRTFTPQTHVQNNAQTDMTVDYTIRVPTT